MTPSTVAILGASGVLGSALARRFSDQGWSVVTVSRSPDSDRQYDPSDQDSVTTALAGSAITVSPLPVLPDAVATSVLNSSGVLLTVGALSTEERARVARSTPDDATGSIILNGGMAPGLTNLAAGDLLRGFPQADTVHVTQMMSARGTAGSAGLEYALERLRTARRLSTVTIPFPVEGRLRAFDVSDGHDAWLGDATHGRRARLFLVFPERLVSGFVSTINGAALCRVLPRRLPGERAVPRDITREPFTEWVGVSHNGRALAAMTLRARGDYWTTAAAAEAQAALMLEKRNSGELPTGTHSIESVLTLGETLPRLGGDVEISRIGPAPAG